MVNVSANIFSGSTVMSETTGQKSTSPAARASFADAGEKRSMPEFRDWFRPRNVFSWIFGFIERWFFSRKFGQLLIALPFVLFGIVGSGFLLWLKSAPRDSVVGMYETAATDAIKNEDSDRASIYLEGLVKLRPNEKRYVFQLALHLLQNGQQAKGLSYLQSLVISGPQGYSTARIWVANQVLSGNPVLPWAREECEGQLRQAIDSDPYNLDANKLLAMMHLQNGKFLEAESRLLRVVEHVPALSLILAKVQLQPTLRRSPEQIQFHLANATNYFEGRLLDNPGDEDARTNYSEALVLSGRMDDAAQALQEGLSLKDSLALRSALSSLYVTAASNRLSQSLLNRDEAARLLLKALEVDPANFAAVEQVLVLSHRQAKFKADDLKPAIETLLASSERTLKQDTVLAELLTISGRYEEAIQVLDAHSTVEPRVKAIQASVYAASGDAATAESIVDELLTDFEARRAELSYADSITYGNVLLMKNRFSDVIDLLVELKTAAEITSIDGKTDSVEKVPATQGERVLLAVVEGRALLGLFDQHLNDAAFTDEAAAMQLMEQALRVGAVDIPALDKLAAVATSNGKFAKAADKLLTRLLAEGSATAEIYNMVGTKYLGANQVSEARRNLERAYSLDNANPMVLNNLAIALVRQNAPSKDDLQRALDLISRVLAMLPENADALSTRAEVFIGMQRWEEARRDLEASLPRNMQSVNSRELLVRVYDALNESGLADEHRRILEEMKASEPAAADPSAG